MKDFQVVSSGSQVGPKGVKVVLFPDGKQELSPIQDTLTSENGDFHFTPVRPGKYLVKASHPAWKLSKDSVITQLIKENANIPSSSLVIAGYDVSGAVTSDNEPIKGVSFVLFQAQEVCTQTVSHPFNSKQEFEVRICKMCTCDVIFS
jgi:hypothetical protein